MTGVILAAVLNSPCVFSGELPDADAKTKIIALDNWIEAEVGQERSVLEGDFGSVQQSCGRELDLGVSKLP